VRNISRNLLLLVVAGGLAAAGCGSSAKPGAGGSTTPTQAATGASGHVANPVSKNPSISAKMICEAEVRGEIRDLLGVDTTKPLQPTWSDHVYSCKYVYANGTMTLSVKELANQAETDAYFASLATKLGKTKPIQSLGQGAFVTKNDAAVVRKDYKVLTVDVSGLPAQFGTAHDPRGNVALNVAATIMGCWTGA